MSHSFQSNTACGKRAFQRYLKSRSLLNSGRFGNRACDLLRGFLPSLYEDIAKIQPRKVRPHPKLKADQIKE